jgi:hypothetical protein
MNTQTQPKPHFKVGEKYVFLRPGKPEAPNGIVEYAPPVDLYLMRCFQEQEEGRPGFRFEMFATTDENDELSRIWHSQSTPTGADPSDPYGDYFLLPAGLHVAGYMGTYNRLREVTMYMDVIYQQLDIARVAENHMFVATYTQMLAVVKRKLRATFNIGVEEHLNPKPRLMDCGEGFERSDLAPYRTQLIWSERKD